MTTLQKQVIKPYLEDIFRKKNETCVRDFEYNLLMEKLQGLLEMEEGAKYSPQRKERITREQALKNLVYGIIGKEDEEKVNQLLLMYNSFK